MTVRVAGRVAIITGAGRGLGRQYAIALAAKGAKVVVNDVGGTLEGECPDPTVACAVVDAIRAAGGLAVSSADSVRTRPGASAIVERAIEAYGTVDILINNAGITIRKAFEDMTETDFTDVYETHVLGTFNCCKAVWPLMKERGYGRIVVTTSISGAYGMYNQVNYSTAKAGLIGFTRALAIEGYDHGILVNAVSPMAVTRMSEASQRPEFSGRMTPDWPAALVTCLSADDLTSTGQIVNAGMGYVAKMVMMEAAGVVLADDECTPDAVMERWPTICDMSQATEYVSSVDFIERAIPAILKRRSPV